MILQLRNLPLMQVHIKWNAWSYLLAVLLLCLIGCGRAGESAKAEKQGFDGETDDISGAITNQSGDQGDMKDWVLVLIDRDSGLARVTQVSGDGLYKFRKVAVGGVYSLVLLSPDFIFTAALTLPSPVANTIRQFFRVTQKSLPKLILQGSVISFQNTTGITTTSDLAADSDNDSIPDGSSGFGLSDLDADKTPDDKDADIDGDGILNWFDPDDDGDGNLDVVDGDSNGDLQPDAEQQLTDVYFKQGLDWVSVVYERTPESSVKEKATLKFVTQLNEDYAAPLSVQIRSAASLLGSATVEYVDDETGEESSQAFLDRRLMDDGANEDSSPDDYVFARKITLGTGIKPRPNQVFFFQLAYGSDKDPWYVEFPFTLPSVKMKSITARFDKSTRTVNLVGNPFNALQEYLWSVSVYNKEGLLVYSSTPLKGTQGKTQIVPEHLVEAGDHTFRVVAQLLDQVPGYASFKISTLSYDLK